MQGRDQDFSLRGQDRREGRERGWGSWRGGSNPLPTGLGGLGSNVNSQRGSWHSPDRPKVSTIFSTQDGLSWHYNIVNCGLSCSHWGPRPLLPPPCVRPWRCGRGLVHRPQHLPAQDLRNGDEHRHISDRLWEGLELDKRLHLYHTPPPRRGH